MVSRIVEGFLGFVRILEGFLGDLRGYLDLWRYV